MKIKTGFFLLLFALGLLFSPTLILAQKNNPPDVELPEQAGIYDVPGHPNLKLRVFVHNARPTPPPSPSCDDIADGPDVNAMAWHLPTGDWVYKLNPESVPPSITSTDVDSLTNQAFNAWSATAVGKKVIFTPGLNTTATRARLDYQNIITWGRAPGTALAVTYIWYDTLSNEVIDVDTIMNQKFSWSWTPYVSNLCGKANTYDAQDILTHELGHWMGLDDKYEPTFKENTMYGYGAKAEIKKDTLTTGDIAGAASIY